MGLKWNLVRIFSNAFVCAMFILSAIFGYFEGIHWALQALYIVIVLGSIVWGISAMKDFLGITKTEDKAKTDKALEQNIEHIVNAETLVCVVIANAPTAQLQQLSDLETLSQIIGNMLNDTDVQVVHGQLAVKLR